MHQTSGRPQVNLKSTWKTTASALVSILTHNKLDVARFESASAVRALLAWRKFSTEVTLAIKVKKRKQMRINPYT